MASVATADFPVSPILEGTIMFHVYDDSITGPLDFNPVLMEDGRPSDGARYSGTLLPPSAADYHPYSSYYVGWSREIAIKEAVIRDRARAHLTIPGAFTFARDLLINRSIATVKAIRTLNLVDVRGRDNQDLCQVDRHAMHGTNYDATRKIALTLRHKMAGKTCGMRWKSDQDELQDGAMFVGRPFVPWKLPTAAVPDVTDDWYALTAAPHTSDLDTINDAWADGGVALLESESLQGEMGMKYVMRSFPGPTHLF
jgi:hypothetical protein